MKYFNNLSIRRKLILIIVSVSTLALIVGLITEYSFETTRIIKAKTNNTLFDAQLISSYCAMSLAFNNKIAAHEILQRLDDAPQMHSGVLFTNEDSIFAFYTRSDVSVPKIPNELKQVNTFAQHNWIHVKFPVEDQGKQYGYIYLKVYSGMIEINKLRVVRLIVLLLLLFVVVFFLSDFLQKYISGPIVKLSEHAQKVAHLKDYSLRIKKLSDDEIGVLYNDFNQMLETIEEADNELDDYRMKLEDLVDKRTLALKQTNQELLNAIGEAQKANQAKSDFLSNMSHELRTPLNGILGYAQILKSMGKLEDNQSEQVSIIHSSGKHLLSLINAILDYSKIEAKKLELAVADFSFADLIRHVINIIRIRAEEKDLFLEFVKESEIPEFVKGDEVKIRQVLINLLNNAVKYTNVGKVVLRITFDESKKYNLLIEVEDSGIGIEKDKLEEIFEPFTQIDSKVKFIEGTGLGLTITRKLIELMDGKLSVKSEINKGSVFSVSLNLPIVHEIPKDAELMHNITAYVGNPIKVLIVDDNMTNLSLLITTLEPIGFEVITAQNGEQAIEHTKTYKPDLILMDLVMPIMNGTKAIQEIRKLPDTQNIKIIGVTASVIQRAERINFIACCNGHIDKPIIVNQLFELIRNLLDIEWIKEDALNQNKILEYKQNAGKTLVPEGSILNAIVDTAEIGDFSTIESIVHELVQSNSNYYAFKKEVSGYIDRYDSDRLINYINTLR